MACDKLVRAPSTADARRAVQVAEQVPVLVERIHDMLVRAAARVEAAHEKMDDMRRGFLQRRREFGDERNPFGASEVRGRVVLERLPTSEVRGAVACVWVRGP